MFARTKIQPEDGIVTQLCRLGVEPKELQAVILSHLHGDHAGGLEELLSSAPDVPVYVSKLHWETFGESPVAATLAGCNPQRWPSNFVPRLLEMTDEAVGPWESSSKITTDGRILAVSTPGHVAGHISLIVYGDSHDGNSTTYFLPADATYGLDLLDAEEVDGVTEAPETALDTIKRIKQYAAEKEVVILPSHDPNTPLYLRNRKVYQSRLS
ncbi:uncharacterized protein JN550_006812 [Neoarthrinium moseri]|uniref:uncharacterized protein n=1 Tax=Neoarthrinium moseri TaxID=1658444 RepID=UPI001FDE2FAE|nr:uncharacterized protein JN550_006812 [Neoarthrinium moseri]KAI1868005.1 hypothetical protein JN550_006812 [Neoarthrinium moseri]